MAAKKKATPVAQKLPVAPPVPLSALVQTVSDSTLEQTHARALSFLRGATRREIARRLAAVGYTGPDHAEGWTLLQQATGYSPSTPMASLAGGPTDPSVAAAVKFVDEFDEEGFGLTEAALQRRFPAQNEFVMGGLTAKTGQAALVDVEHFLDRLDQLESGEGRKPETRAADRAAVALLETRTITKEKRKALREALRAARKFEVDTKADDAGASKAEAEARKQATLGLRAWYEEWSKTARSVIKRRDQLIALGLAQRQSRQEEPTPTGADGQPLVLASPPVKKKRARKKK